MEARERTTGGSAGSASNLAAATALYLKVKSADEMDQERAEHVAYEYLCRLEEARVWISACINEELRHRASHMEEQLMHGVYLAKLAKVFVPDLSFRIFDEDLSKYNKQGLHFRHTDNINHFLRAAEQVGLPQIFMPETTDIYDGKNLPKVILCLHALSLLLSQRGLQMPRIENVTGKAEFSDKEIHAMQSAIQRYGLTMPHFDQIGGIIGHQEQSQVEQLRNEPRVDRYSNQYLREREVEIKLEKEEEEDIPVWIDEALVTRLQAYCRGFLIRSALFHRFEHYYRRETEVIRAQALWRGCLARRRFRKLVLEAMSAEKKCWKTKIIRDHRHHLSEIVCIQRAWRDYKRRLEFEKLLKSEDITLNSVRQFLHLLDLRPEDFDQELELQDLKAAITKAIRNNQSIEKELDALDIKIGLLVKNRISVEEVAAHRKNQVSSNVAGASVLLKNATNGNGVTRKETFYHNGMREPTTLSRAGLKALRKESRERLEAYQHLFYLLQTQPNYLAKLVFAMPQTKTTQFLENVIFSLYNFGANQREEYLLLQLFRVALEEEVRCKVDKLDDIVTGQPFVIRMIVSFYRRHESGQRCLRDILGPLIGRLLADRTLKINTNPVEIYKHWINQRETDSGKAQGLPYDVNNAAALEHEEVRHRLERSITRLKQVATLFMTTIVKSKSRMPFGLLYLAKVLYNSLHRKFSEASDKEILKVIGNLIYYRYFNSAIVAPDSCDIINVAECSDSGVLSNDQRKNLGAVAKILQYTASKRGFGEESAHLIPLNSYIVEGHDKFRRFFFDCTQVPEPEEHFGRDQSLADHILIAKPVVHISLAEIVDTHHLLLQHRNQIASKKNDPLQELLDDLGSEPSLCALLGAADLECKDSSMEHLGQSEVTLTLSNKSALSVVPWNESKIDLDRLFLRTKHLLVTILPCTSGETLMGALKGKSTGNQEESYETLLERRAEVERRAEDAHARLDHTSLFSDKEEAFSLEEAKRHVVKSLQILDRHGYVSLKNGFKSLVTSLGEDIVEQKQHRSRRRREIIKLKTALKSLEEKKAFFQSQLEYYDEYVRQCLANQHSDMTARKKRVRFHQATKKANNRKESKVSNDDFKSGRRMLKHKEIVRYSGLKLYQKGILIGIEGLPLNQLKNVMFEFVPSSEDEGVFEVHARFMGVRLEHVDVDIQDLLQLQYEGVAVMNIFGKARINVNLLLHLLNVKFYGKK